MAADLTHQLVREAENSDSSRHVFDADEYAEVLVGNPCTDAAGQSYNWEKNLAPDNSVQIIRNAETLADGVAEVAETVGLNLIDYSGKKLDKRGWYGIYQAVANRFGVGAYGERVAVETLNLDDTGALPGDEENGVDVREGPSPADCWQIKTAETPRSPCDWPRQTSYYENLAWVRTSDAAVFVHDSEEGWIRQDN